MQPDEEAHAAYRELIHEMNVSGAEVIRQAIVNLHKQRRAEAAAKERAALREAV
ncbi:hypothetical protein [Streptomyces sp. NPDC018045]|uniref:hypothetical protein n=1 Tax=Streptomyces sp. NPDC018045 TaxID=3365037 RepID=UPI0037948F15